MGQRGRMQAQAVEKYGEDLNTLMPKLIRKYRTPYYVARQLGVYPNAVRRWLHRHGWSEHEGKWKKRRAVTDATGA